MWLLLLLHTHAEAPLQQFAKWCPKLSSEQEEGQGSFSSSSSSSSSFLSRPMTQPKSHHLFQRKHRFFSFCQASPSFCFLPGWHVLRLSLHICLHLYLFSSHCKLPLKLFFPHSSPMSLTRPSLSLPCPLLIIVFFVFVSEGRPFPSEAGQSNSNNMAPISEDMFHFWPHFR